MLYALGGCFWVGVEDGGEMSGRLVGLSCEKDYNIVPASVFF